LENESFRRFVQARKVVARPHKNNRQVAAQLLHFVTALRVTIIFLQPVVPLWPKGLRFLPSKKVF